MSAHLDIDDKLLQKLKKAAALSLATLGKVAGSTTLAEAIAEPALKQFVTDMLAREIMPSHDITEADRAPIAAAILDELANDTRPIEDHAKNASLMVSDVLLDPVRQRLHQGEPSIRLSLAVASWMDFAGGEDDAGEEYDYEDPLIGRLLFLSMQARTNPDALATAFLSLDQVFGDDLPNAALFRQQVVTHLGHLLHQGVLPTIEMVLHGPEIAA